MIQAATFHTCSITAGAAKDLVRSRNGLSFPVMTRLSNSVTLGGSAAGTAAFAGAGGAGAGGAGGGGGAGVGADPVCKADAWPECST